jgi:hypothetical protein
MRQLEWAIWKWSKTCALMAFIVHPVEPIELPDAVIFMLFET